MKVVMNRLGRGQKLTANAPAAILNAAYFPVGSAEQFFLIEYGYEH